MIQEFLRNNYNLSASSIKQMTTGAGGSTYRFEANNKLYVLKLTDEDAINHPKIEPTVCEILRNSGIRTLHFVKNTHHAYSTNFQNSVANVYEYISGRTVPYNSMDGHLVNECASVLANIHTALEHITLPYGLSQDFFDFMTPERALSSYQKSLAQANAEQNPEIIRNIEARIALLPYISTWHFDTSKLTYRNTHGDFTNNQIILNDAINIIDFTACCAQPAIWELTRFFFHADKSAKAGHLDKARYTNYLHAYTDRISLTAYDMDNIFKLYFYQLLVCDYYSQYFHGTDSIKKNDYLNQANFASNILNANRELIMLTR